ncbi:hypothetical protein [Rhodococcus sp. NPDC006774]|uniref:hypothetical protein n=1 Tax=Rhodococcus sp. NPDC006774 TaxID=3157186 RepID=UPI0033C01ADF
MMMGTPLAAMPPQDDQQRKRWYRRPWWLIAAAVVVITALVFAVAQTTGGSDDAAPPPVSTPSFTPPPSTGLDGYLPDTVDGYGQRLRVPNNPAGLALPQQKRRGETDLNAPAEGVQWQQIYGRGAAVFSTSDGPSSIDAAGLAQGIAQTPQGSAIAASQIVNRLYFGPPQVQQKVLADQVLGPDSAKESLAGFSGRTQQLPATTTIRIDPQYVDTFSRVSLAVGPISSADYPSGQYYSVSTMTMVWDGGQWKWRIPADGLTAATGSSPVESVTGWTQW